MSEQGESDLEHSNKPIDLDEERKSDAPDSITVDEHVGLGNSLQESASNPHIIKTLGMIRELLAMEGKLGGDSSGNEVRETDHTHPIQNGGYDAFSREDASVPEGKEVEPEPRVAGEGIENSDLSDSEAKIDLKIQNERVRQLEEIGFKRIGDTQLLQYGEFILRVNDSGELNFFTDFRNTGEGKVKGVKVGNFMGNPEIQTIIRVIEKEDGTEWTSEYTLGGSGGVMLKSNNIDTPTLKDFEGKDLDQQLTDAGFRLVSEDEGVYHTVFTERGKKSDVYALVEGGNLVRVLKPAEPFFDRYGRGKKIVESNGIDSLALEEDKNGRKILKGKNNSMEFSFDPSGNLQIERLLRDFTPEELGIAEQERIEEDSGFVIGGVNSTDTIKKLQKINGISIRDLERRMYPQDFRDFTGAISMAGFLGFDEHLLDVMADDNDFVQSQGLTHQEIGRMLIYAEEISDVFGVNEFSYQGRNYRVDQQQWRGFQDSPFADRTAASRDIRVTNINNGKSIKYSALLGPMVSRYGFYEGKGTSYRLEPEKVIEVFDFLQEHVQSVKD